MRKVAVKWRRTEEFEHVITVPDDVDLDTYMDEFDADELAVLEGPDDGTFIGTPDRWIEEWEVHSPAPPSLVTIEVSEPGARYTLLDSTGGLSVHLAESTQRGTGPILCGFDRFAVNVGFSVGGGVTGPGVTHRPCSTCASLIAGRQVSGTHAHYFTEGSAS